MAFAWVMCMSQGMRLVRFEGDESQIVARTPLAQDESGLPIAKQGDGDPLKHFRNVTSSVMRDALSVWADLWGELQNGVASGVAVDLEGGKGFEPSCGWPEFLDKMWVLRQNLDFLSRFSRQGE